jgi:hypothetical protein
MALSTVSRRRSSSRAQAAAAKRKREKIMLVVGAVLLAVLLAWRGPSTIKQLTGGSSTSSSTSSSGAPATQPQSAADSSASGHGAGFRQWRPRDPMGTATSAGPDTWSEVSPPAGLRDPFSGGPHSSAVSTAPATPTLSTPATPSSTSGALPQQLVIGTPGAGRSAKSGWIVILASIPTAKGEKAAGRIAANARNVGLGSVSVLNSSNRRPLRGGYWVVYTGPFQSLAEVSKQAGAVHGKGFVDAYIRQLIVYGRS